MMLKTARAEGVADVRIEYEECNACGLCVRVCRGGPLYLDEGKVRVDQTRFFGCIACGQCVTVCPLGCILVAGRDLNSEDLVEMPPVGSRAAYDQLQALMISRRSVRDFEDRPVERELIDKIIQAATTAPMGIPPTDVSVLVLNGRAKVKEFRSDLLEAMRRMTSRWMLPLWRPFMTREAYDLFKSFVIPVVEMYIEKDAEGIDWFFYDAPLAMLFYTSAYGDMADPVIAATYAMLAAESLGLGSCMLGFPAPVVKYAKNIRRKYQLPAKLVPGVCIIFGYPDVRYRRALRRRLASVQYH
jgi:nitroreductase/NAD-dependent dihydropyrimidine dehydrogenase PreA subunit